MKKIKKSVSILLAILMVVSLFTIVPITAGAEPNDPACTETIVPANLYGTLYNEEGDPEGEGLVDYKGTYVNAHPNHDVDIDDGFANFSMYPMDFDEDEEDRCFLGITAKNEKVISGIDVKIDDSTSGEPVIYVGDSTNYVTGVRNGDVYSFTDINSESVKLSASDWYLYVTQVVVYCDDPAPEPETDPAVENVIDLIDAIGTVEYTDACKAKIDDAKTAYDALTDTQKELVTNYTTLTDAEAAYEALAPARTYKVVVYDPWAYNTKTYTEAATVPFVITGTELIQFMGLDPEYTVSSVTLSSGSNVSVSGTNITINDIGTSKVSIGLKEQTSSYVMSFSRDFEITVTTTYSITWLNEDGTAFDTTSVTSGTSPSHAGPTKDADDDYTYTFSGWTDGENTYAPNALPAATADATYKAVFTPVQKYETGYYIVGTFTGGEGGWKFDPDYKLSENTETEGEYYFHNLALTSNDAFKVMYVAPGVRTWYPDNAPDYTVSADGKYDVYFRPDYQGGQDWHCGCIFTEKAKFTVTWKNDDGSVIDTTTVAYGDTPTHDDAAKNENEYYTFAFSGWTPEITAVTGNVTYTATYTHTAKQEEGLIKRFTFEYEDELDEMTFIDSANGAKWIWSDYNGGKYDYTVLAYQGKHFVMSYSFIDYVGSYHANNWMITPAIEIPEYVTHMTFYATNANVYYPEKFDVCVGSSADPSSMTVIRTVVPTTSSDGWSFFDIDLTAYAGQTIYVGFHDTCYDMYEAWLDLLEFRYDNNTPAYTVTWKNGDTELEADCVASGSAPTYNGEEPAKDEDEDYTYTFAGWSDGVNTYGLTDTLPAVSGDVVYTAVFTAERKPFGKNGLVFENDGSIRFYVNDQIVYSKGLVKDDEGNIYYINSTGKAVKNTHYSFSTAKTNGLLPKGGTYRFDENGHMQFPRQGLVFENGVVRYYENDQIVYSKGLVRDEDTGYLYYINSTGKAVKNTYYSFSTAKTNGLLPKGGTYRFDEYGHLCLDS